MKKFCCFCLCLYLSLLCAGADTRVLLVSGQTVMINAQYEGVFVSGDFDFMWHDQLIESHPVNSIQTGDKIIKIKNQLIQNINDLNQILSHTPIQTTYLDVTVERESKHQSARLYLYYDEQMNTFKTGFYVKDHISGIGTLTYIDPMNMNYGALGHEIAEKTTGKAADIHKGEMLSAQVTSIVPSKINQPGEKLSRSTGILLADIIINNEFGLFGKMKTHRAEGIEMPVASQHLCHTGKASFLTVIHDTELKEIEIEITKVHHQTSPQIKGIEFKITDESFCSQTGGIVQGMSGSPIIQDNRIVGAVTHMIPSSPHKGYGIFIEWMLMNSDQIQ